MRAGSPRRLGGPSKTPGRIFENLLIVGSQTGRRLRLAARRHPRLRRAHRRAGVDVPHRAAPRRVRLRDLAGECARVRRRRQQLGRDDASIAKHGLVFVPLGSPTHDLYGADRVGDNLFGNSLVALDARTGTRKWHFQTVHHDLWDYDLAAAPKLLTVRHQGATRRHRRAGGQDRIPLRVRAPDRQAAVADRRAARSRKSEVPGEVSVADAAVPDQAGSRSRGSRSRRRTSTRSWLPEEQASAETGRARGRQRRPVHAVERQAHPTSSSPAPGAARTGAAPRPIPPPACSTCAASRCRAIARCRCVKPAASDAPAIKGGAARATGLRRPSSRSCSACHGPGAMPMRSPATLGAENFRKLVRQGQSQMPPFPEAVLPGERLEALEAYLLTLAHDPTKATAATRTRRCGCRRIRRAIRARTCATPARSRRAGTPATACPRPGRRSRSSSPMT